MAALIGSAHAKAGDKDAVDFAVSEDKFDVNGKLYFFKHPISGKPYINVEAKYKNIELKDGFAMCFDFAPASLDKDEFIKGKDESNYPVNFKVEKGSTESAPIGYTG